MNHLPKKTILISSLVLPLTLGAATASAAQITEWNYTVVNEFSDTVFSAGTGTVIEGASELSWGSDDDRSSISITPLITEPPVLVTNGGPVDGGTFTHVNQPIPDDSAMLQSFNLNSTLSLSAAAPDSMAGQGPGDLPVVFSSFFTETLNNGSCVPESTSNCDDIFSLGNPDFGFLNEEGNFVFAAPSFTIDDFSYTVFLEIVGLGALSDAACGVAGADSGCIGFLTMENATNTFQSNFRIESSAVSVPEPGTLALFGLGLVGLGIASRRK